MILIAVYCVLWSTKKTALCADARHRVWLHASSKLSRAIWDISYNVTYFQFRWRPEQTLSHYRWHSPKLFVCEQRARVNREWHRIMCNAECAANLRYTLAFDLPMNIQLFASDKSPISEWIGHVHHVCVNVPHAERSATHKLYCSTDRAHERARKREIATLFSNDKVIIVFGAAKSGTHCSSITYDHLRRKWEYILAYTECSLIVNNYILVLAWHNCASSHSWHGSHVKSENR